MNVPEDIARELPDGYSARWKAPHRDAIPWITKPWRITGSDWSTQVAQPDMVLPAIRAHIADGQPPSPVRMTKQQAREATIIRDAERMTVYEVAKRHDMTTKDVLRLIRVAKRPRFTATPEAGPSRRPYVPGHVATVRFTNDDTDPSEHD